MELNENQLRAVRHDKGPMMVIAGPGSGKTTVITCRIYNMVKKLNISGDDILVITFTRAAASEMKQRYEKMSGSTDGITFGTFHAFFYMVLRKAYGVKCPEVISEIEKYRLVGEAVDKRESLYDSRDDYIKYIISEISKIKNNMISPQELSGEDDTEDLLYFYNYYENGLRRNHKIDFDDMALLCHRLLKERTDIRRRLISKYKYILIDEFQDINPIQFETVKLLLSMEKNLFVVGDDDQSVYSFRGAKPDLMLNLKNDFPEIIYVYLNINYRCKKSITDAAERLIVHNKNRLQKKIVSYDAAETSSLINIVNVQDVKEQNKKIKERIAELRSRGFSYGNMAVLYRTNTEPSGLASVLVDNDIPFIIKEKIPNIFNNFAAENIMDYMKAAYGELPRSRMLRIMNRPDRYINRNDIPEGIVNLDELADDYADRQTAEKISDLSRDLKRISAMRPFAAINYIRKAMEYDRFLSEYAGKRGKDAGEYMDLLDELQDMSKCFSDFDAWFSYRDEYSERLEKEFEKNNGNGNAVTLATMHGAKGLEFDYVFIMNCTENNIPYKKAYENNEIEEERRMFYVALTRARCGVHIYCPEIFHGRRTLPSGFLNEINS